MACTALVDGKRVVGAFLSNDEWSALVKLSKERRVLMDDTKLPAIAKTVRWKGGVTRFFSHFPGEAPEGYASKESPAHAARKLAIYARLLELGIPAELEAGQDDWRADVLVGESALGPALAIEVQLTKQSAQLTYERTHQRSASGVPTLWSLAKVPALVTLASIYCNRPRCSRLIRCLRLPILLRPYAWGSRSLMTGQT